MLDSPYLILINFITGLVALYLVLGIPFHIVRRINRIRKGEIVSPIMLIGTKILRYWMLSAAILMPLGAVLTYFSLSSLGLSKSEMSSSIFIFSILGNILTSLAFGFAYTVYSSPKWSFSADPKNIY